MLDEREREAAAAVLARLGSEVTLRYHPGADPDDALSAMLRQVVNDLVALAGGKLVLLPAREQSASAGELPSLAVGNVVYHAVPTGPELAPLLEHLRAVSGPTPDREGAPPAAAAVEVCIAPTCPNCPAVVATCLRIARAWPQVSLTVVDIMYFTARSHGLSSVPAVLVEGGMTLVGPVSANELLAALRGRSDPDHALRALSSMLEAGRVDDAVPLVTGPDGPEALARLLRGGGLKERMGLLLVCESALEENAHALDHLVPSLLGLLSSDDAAVRGDTADLLGQIGAPGARAGLTALLTDDNEDVREAAAEALDQLRIPS